MHKHLAYDLLNVNWILVGNIAIEECPPTYSENEKINILVELPKSVKYLACGIVRNVNYEQNCIYIILPKLNSDISVNLIVVPDSITIPTGLLTEQFIYQSSSFLPYTYMHNKLK